MAATRLLHQPGLERSISRTESEQHVIDALGPEDDVLPYDESIVSYGADFTVAALVDQLRSGALVVPFFHRSFVWDRRTASRFVESLLLGIPVPGVFLFRTRDSSRYLIVDGQQRLLTLRYFFDGVFGPDGHDFRLTGVQPRFNGLTYRTLDEVDRRRLNEAIIHATIVSQDAPTEDRSTLFFLFERLHSGGVRLTPQEIRRALFSGPLDALLEELNADPAWREIYGPVSPTHRDVELILRFIAFYFDEHLYAPPMTAFLNRYMARNRDLTDQGATEIRTLLERTIRLAHAAFGPRAFRPARDLNAAVFDSVMVGLARRLEVGPVRDVENVGRRYQQLLDDPLFQSGTSRATADPRRVRERFEAAREAFQDVA